MANLKWLWLVGGLAAAQPASAQHLTTLHTFTGGADGSNPLTGLIAGSDGSLFGTTVGGAGSVFRLSRSGGKWTFQTLYGFTGGSDGSFPENLTMDATGAIYGITNTGGTFNGLCAFNGTDFGCGTVFRLTPPASGSGAWTFTTIYAFQAAADGSSPSGGVTLDGQGGLLGFTAGLYTCGTVHACGTAYRLQPPQSGQGAWTETTLASFTGHADGAFAGFFGPPVLAPDGTLFGITGAGGNQRNAHCAPFGGCGLVFALRPAEGGWRKTNLVVFNGADGNTPIGGLLRDRAGNLFGNTNDGGRQTVCQTSGFPSGCGVSYKLVRRGGGWTYQVLHRFGNGADGGYPFSAPAFAGDGALWMTTSGDEVKTFGTITRLIPPPGGQGFWRPETAFTFTNDASGSNPEGTPLWFGGRLYGVTYGDGSGPAPFGTVFAFDPASRELSAPTPR